MYPAATTDESRFVCKRRELPVDVRSARLAAGAPEAPAGVRERNPSRREQQKIAGFRQACTRPGKRRLLRRSGMTNMRCTVRRRDGKRFATVVIRIESIGAERFEQRLYGGDSSTR